MNDVKSRVIPGTLPKVEIQKMEKKIEVEHVEPPKTTLKDAIEDGKLVFQSTQNVPKGLPAQLIQCLQQISGKKFLVQIFEFNDDGKELKRNMHTFREQFPDQWLQYAFWDHRDWFLRYKPGEENETKDN